MSPSSATAAVSSLLDTVHQIEPLIRAYGPEAERERRLPDAVANAMRERGLYRLWRPKAFGGLEVDPMTAFQVFEEVSRIDSAAGWNLMVSCSFDCLGAWFSDEGAKEIFALSDVTLAGSFFPPRRAVPVEGGYRVTGQTPFVSGAYQAKWIIGLANIYEGDMPRLGENGAPVAILTACPASEVVVMDTWRTLGMRGTGSHDVLTKDLFVPAQRTAVLAPYESPGSAYHGPLYKFTVWATIAALASIATGIARAAIDDLLNLAGRKTPAYTAKSLRDRGIVQALLGEAEATLGGGRAFLYEALREVWDGALQNQIIDMPRKMKLQLAATYAVGAATKAVDLVHAAVGATGIHDEYGFQRHFRDLHTITQHAYVSASRYESVGQYFLGVPIEWPFYGL
jgi:alkylation response protein AidB-like acyl-CoA dehydrogenase